MKHSFPKNKIKIVLTEGIASSATEALRQAGYSNITELAYAPDATELKTHLETAHFLGVRSRTLVNADVLSKAPKLIGIGCFCIGTNNIDLATARLKGIPVFNAPFSNTRSVAELTLASIILLLRDLPTKYYASKNNLWLKTAKGAHEVRGKSLGIVGYGNIGSQVSILADFLGMQIRYYDIVNKLSHGNATAVSSLEELYKKSDIITYHVPSTTHTKNMVRAETIKKMKSGVKIINFSRGNVVNLDDLATALKDGSVSGAAVDVYPEEPENNDKPFHTPLHDLDNVLLTPHIAGSTEEAQTKIGNEVADKFIMYSDNGSTVGVVNFPEVSLPTHVKSHRIINIHLNKPGLLAKINKVFYSNKANVVGQFLQTKDEIGYVVTDVEYDRNVLNYVEDIKKIKGSIKTRLLH